MSLLLAAAEAAKTAASVPEVNVSLQTAMKFAGAFAAIGFAAIGSAYGAFSASSAAVGSWKKCYLQNKPAPFQLLIFAGAPLSQTIYGMILMFMIMGANSAFWPSYLVIGTLAGIAMGLSAAYQGIVAGASADAFAETNKGFTNQLMVLGIIETVAIFVMAFSIVLISSIK